MSGISVGTVQVLSYIANLFISQKERNLDMYLLRFKIIWVALLLTGITFPYQGFIAAGEKVSSGKAKINIAAEKGTVNWGTEFITARGIVLIAENETLARRGAIVDANRRLLEIIKGVRIDATTVVSDLMGVSDVVKQEVSGVISHAEIVDERKKNGNYIINMRVPVGKFISLIVKDKSVSMTDPAEPSKFTGLLIDARGHDLEPAIFVTIFNDKDGTKICGPIHPVYRVSTKSIKDVNEERLGENPLRIKIKGTTGQNNVDISLSNGNSKKIRKKIKNTGILSKSKVVIIID